MLECRIPQYVCISRNNLRREVHLVENYLQRHEDNNFLVYCNCNREHNNPEVFLLYSTKL